jgi:FtsP/CotA-like multicopper oxidase with cupredoxin domain
MAAIQGLPSTRSVCPGQFEQALLIADRQFDTQGQILFPDGTPADNPTGINGPPSNPDHHPFWIPEFFGDVMVVNGKSWPFFRVEPRRYRFRVVNSSNARFLQMQLVLETGGQPSATPGPVIWQIGSDGGFLNAPTNLDNPSNPNAPHLFLAPAERADVIVDFAGQMGRRFILSNLQSAVAPFPSGDPPDPNTSGQVMEFRVDVPLSGTDTSFNPAAPRTSLRAQPIVDTAGRHRPCARHEEATHPGRSGGRRRPPRGHAQQLPLEWGSAKARTRIPGSVSNGHGLNSTENPRVGSTET